jgi:hypothetical protein
LIIIITNNAFPFRVSWRDTMKKRYFIIFAVSIIVITAFNFYPYNSDGDIITDTLVKQREDRVEIIDNWGKDSKITLTLTIIVGSLGIILGLIQALNIRRIKLCTAILGATVSIVTLINSTVYKTDYHTYRRKINRANQILEDVDVKLCIDRTNFDGDATNIWLEEIRILLGQVTKMDTDLHAFNKTALEFTEIAYAASAPAPPAWLQRPPQDGNYFYFVGGGQGSSLRVAKQNSLLQIEHSASDQLSEKILRQLPSETNSILHRQQDINYIRNIVHQHTQVVSTYFQQNPRDGMYNYYTLIRIGRKYFLKDLMYYYTNMRALNPNQKDQIFKAIRMVEKNGNGI